MSMNTGGPVGSSRESAIDLTSFPPSERMQRPPGRPPMPPQLGSNEILGTRYGAGSHSGGSMRGNPMEPRRESDIVLPSWQPDSDVNKCPVCQTEFHFFYRKHHCRKCGRVVCAACSPHRITIPRQYIVQPPSSLDEPPSPVSRNLGGGEVVRVCNPCVPDPWTPDSTSDAASRPQQPDDARRRQSHQDALIPERYRYRIDNAGRMRAHSHQPSSNHPSHSNMSNSGFVLREPYGRPPPEPPIFSRPQSHRHTQSGSITSRTPGQPVPRPPGQGSMPGSGGFPTMPQGQVPQPVPPPPRQHTRPRREVREEDECPVCGEEMPPGEAVREAHIQDCITQRFSAPSSSSLPTYPPTAPPRTYSISAAPSTTVPTVPTAAASSGSPPANTRPRATSYRPRGMALYKATEKDCMAEDGEPAECIICFEEFQPGDEMGRMECLCKFHRMCIRRWWDTKGTGSCPTHQLHE